MEDQHYESQRTIITNHNNFVAYCPPICDRYALKRQQAVWVRSGSLQLGLSRKFLAANNLAPPYPTHNPPRLSSTQPCLRSSACRPTAMATATALSGWGSLCKWHLCLTVTGFKIILRAWRQVIKLNFQPVDHMNGPNEWWIKRAVGEGSRIHPHSPVKTQRSQLVPPLLLALSLSFGV